MAKKQENFTRSDYWTEGSSYSLSSTARRGAQSFTTLKSYKIHSVKIRLYRAGLPGNFTVEIQGNSGSNKPNGVIIATGNSNADTLPTSDAELRQIVFSSNPILTVGTIYWIVLKCAGATSSKKIYWICFEPENYYAGGQRASSNDSGTTWIISSYVNSDLEFEIWSTGGTYLKSNKFLMGGYW